MKKYIDEYRRRVDGFFRPWLWWSLWGVCALYFLYMLMFNAILFFKNNYSFFGEMVARDMYTGKLFFVVIYIPLILFTCLLTGHLALGIYKVAKSKKA